MPARLIESLATTSALAELFSDQSVLQAMLDFEAGLARAEARLGIVPQAAADAITAVSKASEFDPAAITRDTLRAGTPSIPFVKALTERVRATNPEAAGSVHWGATSQDLLDTALILLLRRAQPILAVDLSRLGQALEKLSEQHKNTVMLGRTLMQAAPPVTFGLKAAGWLGAIRRGKQRLDAAFTEALVLQFGGASGTLASLGDQGIATARALASEISLGFPEAPWHTHRDRLAGLVCACGVLTGSLAKMARDITLLMQSEVAEAIEPGGSGRGGSSTMPHKRNPIGSMATLAAANRVPGLVSAFLSEMVQEHERAAGSWQAEWPTITAVIQATGLAAASMAEVAEGLSVDSIRMRANIDATRGVIFAERAMMLMGSALGRDVAHKVLEEATRRSVTENRRLAEVLATMPEVTRHLDKTALGQIEVPEAYLGSAEGFRKALLASGRQINTRKKEQ
jgi:3-carboxy-cis,cis-muconate cycloisomerase